MSTFWLLLTDISLKLKNKLRVIKIHFSMESGMHHRSLHTGKTLLSNSKSILVSPKRRKKLLKKRRKKLLKWKEVTK